MVIVPFVCVVYRYFLIGKKNPRLGFLAGFMDYGVLAHYKIISPCSATDLRVCSPKVQRGEMGRRTGLQMAISLKLS